MASRHMNYLRKNAKVILAFMGVVCMFTFLIGPYLYDLLGGRRQTRADENPVAVTWTKGSVRESELNNLRRQRSVAHAFLFNVIAETLKRGGTPVVNGRALRSDQPIDDDDLGIQSNTSDEALVQTMVLAEEARRMGVAVDQAAAKEFVKQISAPELREGDLLDIAQAAVADSHMTVSQLFDHLAYELRAQHGRMLMNAGMVSIPPPPAQMWEFFNRLNRRVTIEAYPIDVAPLVAQFKAAPSPAELQALFEAGQFRDPNPNLAEPGFHKPHTVAFGYVRIDFGPFLEEAKRQITDQRIEEQYQKDIAQGLHKVLELPGIKPAEEKKEGEKPAEEKKEGDKPAEEKPADAKPATEKPADKATDPAKEGCQVAEPPAGDQPPPGEKPASPQAAEKPMEKPAEDKQGEKPGDAKPAETKPGDEKPAETKPEPRFKTLDEVREEIRTKLAQPIAQDARTKAVKDVTEAIESYGRRYRRWESVKEFAKGRVEDPGKLDLTSVAAKHGFQTGTTPLIDRFEASNYEIGKNVMTFNLEAARRGDFRMQSFADLAFGDDEPLYTPHEAGSMLPDVSYIYYRTAEDKLADVTLEQAKPQIVAAWKKQRAYELALADAQKLADKAKGAMSLREAVGDPAKVIMPPSFSWLTTGSVAMGFGEPEMSRVMGIDLAGHEFMQSVFALQPGATGVAPNQAHSIVYVVRLVGQEPSDDVLRQQFLESGLNFQVVGVAQREMQQTAYEWYRDIEKQYQVKWQRPSHEARRRAM